MPMKVPNEIPLLKKNTASSCPQSKKEMAEYLTLETNVRVPQKALTFVRTAKIGRIKYWLWHYALKNGEEGWLVVHTHWVLFIFPFSCIGSWGESDWSAEQLLWWYHHVNIMRMPPKEVIG